MKTLLLILILMSLNSCSLFRPAQQFEMERLSEDVLTSKSGKGVSIQIVPIDGDKK